MIKITVLAWYEMIERECCKCVIKNRSKVMLPRFVLIRAAEDLRKMKSVRHVVPIRIAKLGKMILLSASVNKIMQATPCKAVDVNATPQEIARHRKSVNGLNAYLFAEKAVTECRK